MQNYFFPNRTSESVGKVVNLIHDDITQVHQRFRVGIDHVAQDLGGHHHNLGIRILVGVSGEQTDSVGAIALDHLCIFLVAERLDWSRVENLQVFFER